MFKVSDIIARPPEANKYQTLKNALISRIEKSGDSKLQRLLQSLDLGDKKPSELLREMRSLATNQISDDVVQKLWLKRLPNQISVILAISCEPLDKLASMADKILETYTFQPQVNAISAGCSNISSLKINSNEKNLAEEIKELRLELNKLKCCNIEKAEHHRARSRSRSRSSAEKKPHCWYHYKFKDNAKKMH